MKTDHSTCSDRAGGHADGRAAERGVGVSDLRRAPDRPDPRRRARREERRDLLGYGWLVFGMAIKVKDTSAVAAKYVQRAAPRRRTTATASRAPAATGKPAPRTVKATSPRASRKPSRKAYGKGRLRVGAKYVANATKLGAGGTARRPERRERLQAGVQPYLDKLKSLVLPAEGAASLAAEPAAREHGRAGARQAEDRQVTRGSASQF
jgi:hypothetical protein